MSTKQTHRLLLALLLAPVLLIAGVTFMAPVTATGGAASEYPTRVVKLALTANAALEIPAGLVDGETIRWWITQTGTRGTGFTLTPGTGVILPVGTTSIDLPDDDTSVSLIVGAYDATAGKVRLTGFLKFAE